MIKTDINSTWATKIEFDNPLDFFNQPKGYWRELLYQRKLLIFKKMAFTKEDYAKFSLEFGRPWTNQEYQYSHEHTEDIVTDNGVMTLSPFSNRVSTRIKLQSMPYHADIPNKATNPFPIRSLWITKNPRPEISGITGFLNITEEAFSYLTQEQRDLLDQIKIIQQSWYSPGTDLKEYPFIKTQPITGERSLRLNYYNKGSVKGAWICGVKINDQLQPDCLLVEQYLRQLLQFKELQYFHTWDTFDILIYDNYPFVHNRSELILEPGEERHFYRMNIDHLDVAANG